MGLLMRGVVQFALLKIAIGYIVEKKYLDYITVVLGMKVGILMY